MNGLWWSLWLLMYSSHNFLPQVSGSGTKDLKLKAYQPGSIKVAIGRTVSLYCVYNYTREMGVGFFYTQPGEKKITQNGNPPSIKCSPVVSEGKLFSCEVFLNITDIKPENEDVYYCKVIIPGPDGTAVFSGNGTSVTVHAEPSSIEIHPPTTLVSGQENTLHCKASGFYPESISVIWLCRGVPLLPNSTINNISRSSDGTFSLHSQHRFSPSAADHNADCGCQLSHPDWPNKGNTSIRISVGYGPSSVNVTSSSISVSNGSVSVAVGSPLTVTCVSDGNPTPETLWFRGNISALHSGDTLHIPRMQKENQGLYWCVARNRHGERNISIYLQVSESEYTGGNKTLYGLVAIPAALLLTVLVCSLCRKEKERNAQTHTGLPPDSQNPEGLDPFMAVVYAVPKALQNRAPKTGAASNQEVESELVYADIRIPTASRNVKMKKEKTIYSTVGMEPFPEGQGDERHSIYALAGHPQRDQTP